MLIQKQNNKLMLQEIKLEMKLQMQEYFFFLLKKQKKPCEIFHKEL